MASASTIMDGSRACLNDVGGQIYTNAALLPYLQLAWGIMQQEMRSAGIPTVVDSGAEITLPAGTTLINQGTSPALPAGLYNIKSIREKGVTEPAYMYEILDDVIVLPAVAPDRYLRFYTWSESQLEFIGSTEDRMIQIRFLKSLPEITSDATEVDTPGVQQYLELKTAALASILIGQNRTRGDYLEGEAGRALRSYTNVEIKGTQGSPVRRLPYGFSRRMSKWRTP